MKKSLVVLMTVAALTGLIAVPVFAADKLVVKDAGGTNTVFVVTDTGKVGVRTDSPQNSLHLNLSTSSAGTVLYAPNSAMSLSNDGNSVLIDALIADNTATPGYRGTFRGVRARGTLVSPAVPVLDDLVVSFIGGIYDGAVVRNTADISLKVDGTVSSNVAPQRITFNTRTAGTGVYYERLTIKNDGKVGIGTSNPAYPLQMGGGAYSTGTQWIDFSSREYKENIENLSAQEAIATLDGLNPVRYNYKADAEDKHVGFIAEDVPDLVATKDRKGLSSLDIVAVLTKVVQEQRKMIEALSAKVDMLETATKPHNTDNY